MDNSVLVQERGKATAYNKTLVPGTESEGSYTQEALQSASEEYDSILNLSGDGIMGYIEIPKINVHLPIAVTLTASKILSFPLRP